MGTLGGSSLFSGITSGLSSTYSILANSSSGNVTASSITQAMGSSTYANSLNSSFASYILSNFTSLDKDGNGTLTSAELSTVNNMINSSGLTAAQLSQLGSASGLSSKTLSQVLDHFADIDANKDGKVTTAEINAYNLTSTMEKKKTEFRNQAAANQSVFYGDESASSTKADSSSMLAYKYLTDENGN